MYVFFDTDQMSHFFWRHMDPTHPAHDLQHDATYCNALLDYYQFVDERIGRMIEISGPDTNIMIISDHGSGPLHQDVYLNEWLRQQGFLSLQQDVAQHVGFRRILAKLSITRRGVSSFLQKNNLSWLENWLSDHLGERVYWLPRTPRAEFPLGIDWTKTRAYSFGYQGQIYINLKNREPQGIVNPGPDYESVCQEIISALNKLIDPKDNKPVVDAVYRKEDIFKGEYTDFAPDLTLVMRGMSYITRYGYEYSPEPGKIFTDPTNNESGSHREQGLIIASGPNLNQMGYCSEKASLLDLAPTILYLLDCPIPDSLDGQLLNSYLKTPRPIQFTHIPSNDTEPNKISAPLTEEEEQEMIARLKDMGYLE